MWYDKNARNRNLKPGDKVHVFLTITGHSLQARYYDPYEIKSKISDVNYEHQTKTKTSLSHENDKRISRKVPNKFLL